MYVCSALESIKQNHSDRDRREAEIAALKARIEELNAAIVVCQEKLPVSGAPVTRQVCGWVGGGWSSLGGMVKGLL